MKVILLKAVPKVGKPEDIVEVNEGYARNALFPNKLAVPATDAYRAELTKRQSARAADKAVRKVLLDKAIEELTGKDIVYRARANKQGNLFSKVSAKDIVDFLLQEHRLDIDQRCLILPDDDIKKTGIYMIHLRDGQYSRSFHIEIRNK